MADMAERHARATALAGIARAGERPQRHSVESVGKGDHMLAAGHLARKLQRRLDGVGAGRPGEHRLVAESAWRQDRLVQLFTKSRLGFGLKEIGRASCRDRVCQYV